MGISQGPLKMLMREGIRRHFAGSVLTLARQQIYVTNERLIKIAIEMNYTLSKFEDSSRTSTKNKHGLAKPISDVALFHSLGFSEVKSLDYSDYEGANEIFDLNSRELPEHLEGAFDVVLDPGTIEHVFHLPNTLKNIFKMIPVGGRIIHISPSSNHIDHGFYMFSPTLFFDYYRSNRFEINTFNIIKYSQNHDTEPWLIYDYMPGCLDPISFGGLDDGMYGILCIVTKSKDSSYDVIPQQGSYVKTWNLHNGEDSQKSINSKNKLFLAIKSAIIDNYYACRILLPIIITIRSLKRRFSRKGINLKVKARY